jgi:hypothetical protein
MRKRHIILTIVIGVFFSCSDSNTSYLKETMKKTDKVYLYKRFDNNEFYPVKSFSKKKIVDLTDKIELPIRTEHHRQFVNDFRLDFFVRDSLIGTLHINLKESQFVVFNSSEISFGYSLNETLENYLKEIESYDYIIPKTIDTINTTYYEEALYLSIDSLSVIEFIEFLPLKEAHPYGSYNLQIVEKADLNWITKDDIDKLIKYINSDQPAYCVVYSDQPTRAVKEESTIGGQVMEIIDSYKFRRPYPDFCLSWSKTDQDRVIKTLDWWNENKQ